MQERMFTSKTLTVAQRGNGNRIVFGEGLLTDSLKGGFAKFLSSRVERLLLVCANTKTKEVMNGL